MSTIEDNDEFLVQRGQNSHKLSAKNLMSTIDDNDYMLIQRGENSFKVKCSDVKSQLGGGTSRAALEILEGPGSGTTINLLDGTRPDGLFFSFESGETYKIKSLDNFTCRWDLCGEGVNGGNGRAGKKPAESYPDIPGDDTVVSCDSFTATAGAGTGGGSGKRTDGRAGTGGVAAYTGNVPGTGTNGLAEITMVQGVAGAGGIKPANGQDAASPVPEDALFDDTHGGATGGLGDPTTGSDVGPAGGGGAGGGSYMRLSGMSMTKDLELNVSLGSRNSAAVIRFIAPP